MQLRAILVLLLVGAAAAGLVWLQTREARSDPTGLGAGRVLDGFDLERLAYLEVDHAERGYQMRLQRDARRQWILTDPIAYPAEGAAVQRLLDALTQASLEPVPAGAEPAKLGLEPPRARIRLTEHPRKDGSPGTVRELELGSLDVDGAGLYARLDGRLVRTVRTIDSSIADSDRAYRSRRLVDTGMVDLPIELRREVADPELAEVASPDGWLGSGDFSAFVTEGTWTLDSPEKASFDPVAVRLYLQQVLALRARGFVSDDPGPLEDWDLDEPALVLDFTTGRGLHYVLRFGRWVEAGVDIWIAMREGHDYVWEVDHRDVRYLATAYDAMLDYRPVRAKRELVRAVEWRGPGGGLRLERDGDAWTIVQGDGTELPADPGRVEDALSRLDKSELEAYLGPDAELVPTDPASALFVETDGGRREGGEVGRAGESDEDRTVFRRPGRDAVYVLPPELEEILALGVSDLESRVVQRLTEREQRLLVVRRGELQRRFELDLAENLWKPEGEDAEARAVSRIVDRVLSVRALAWRSDPTPPRDGDAIEVVVESRTGDRATIVVFPADDERDLCFVPPGPGSGRDGGRLAEVREGLHAGLARVLD